MYIYIVLNYFHETGCKIDRIYSNKEAAEERVKRLRKSTIKNNSTTHIIKKKVYGQLKVTLRDIKICSDVIKVVVKEIK